MLSLLLQLAVTQAAPPRIAESIIIDGVLDEPAWQRAARLENFTQFSPADGRPALRQTVVLVWYSPNAIHFGIQAAAEPGTVRAHLTDRDRGIIPDDYIELQIGTFNDGRSAFVFAVNPLGVQADGALVEGNIARRLSTETDRTGGREQPDLSPDYLFDSRGQVSDTGFVVEVRIPFRSLRFQTGATQDWTLQIIRKSAHDGREDTWAPARRDAASFLAQHGKLTGLTGLERGLVLEVNPIVTSTITGEARGGGWDYRGGRPDFGGNVRWGMATNFTLNGTVNPDFSQVESDAGQITPDPRRALFFTEKRPFFLDGLEYFTNPSQVIYTRRIAAPVAAAKFTGKVAGTSVGILSAVDGQEASRSRTNNPVFNLIRLLRDVGDGSRLGFAYADRIEGDRANRVAELDGRVVFGGNNSLSFHAAASHTRDAGAGTTAPLWYLAFNRAGRRFGLNLSFTGISDEFQAESGFLQQADFANLTIGPSITAYGGQGAFLERFNGAVSASYSWNYSTFIRGESPRDRQYWFNTSWAFRGGYQLSGTLFVEEFGFDPNFYRDYRLEVTTGTGVEAAAFGTKPSLPVSAVMLRLKTPEVAGFGFDGFAAYGRDPNYLEWSDSRIVFARFGLTYRPTDKLRFEVGVPVLAHYRRSDGRRVDSNVIPRLKMEYQLSRAVFLRFVGEYRSAYQDDLRDDGRSNAPILIRDPSGDIRDPSGDRFKRATGFEINALRVDWLFSYQPTPGTVFFAGYGATLDDDGPFRFGRLDRRRDGFFTKLSYLFRA
ncbi:MAG: carbohydrate binding family 9 domain-containing protein [Gemmatimonadetes bacterium]|nr:carbohydrate binding family 9 domain-containing protein [Gemmatimonadota bacterium]